MAMFTCPKPRIPFFVHEYWGSEVTHLGGCIGSYKTCSTRKPCAKAVPETDYFTQQKQYHKRTTLRTLKIPLQSICSKEGLHYCFEWSVKKLSSDKQQSTYSRVWISLGDSIPRLYCVAWQSLTHARKCQFEDFCEKEMFESCSFQRMLTAETFSKRWKRENSPVVRLLPGSHEHLASRNPCILCQKHWGACMVYQLGVPMVQEMGQEIGFPCSRERRKEISK